MNLCLQAAASGAASDVAEIELYLQAVFTLLDVLGNWVKSAWVVATLQASVAATLAPVRAAAATIPAKAAASVASKVGPRQLRIQHPISKSALVMKQIVEDAAVLASAGHLTC